jgi:hypothetical protein
MALSKFSSLTSSNLGYSAILARNLIVTNAIVMMTSDVINIIFIVFLSLLNELIRKEQHGSIDMLTTCGVGVSMINDTPTLTVIRTAFDLVVGT